MTAGATSVWALGLFRGFSYVHFGFIRTDTMLPLGSSPDCHMCVGRKAGQALKRTTSLLITSRWTKDHAPTNAMDPPLPSFAIPSVQEGQHSLLDADSILARDIPNLRTTAAMEQINDSTSEAHSPIKVDSLEPAAPAPTGLAPAPQHHPAAEPAPTAELHGLPGPTPLQAHPAAREATPPALPTNAQPAAAVEPVVPAVEHLKLPSPTLQQAHLAAHQAATPAQPAAAVEPTAAAVEPAQVMSPAPVPAKPAALVKPEVLLQPTRVQFFPPQTSKAAVPQGTPQASAHSHNPLAAEGSMFFMSEDKVVSTSCLGIFCCFKAGRRGKSSSFGTKKQ